MQVEPFLSEIAMHLLLKSKEDAAQDNVFNLLSCF